MTEQNGTTNAPESATPARWGVIDGLTLVMADDHHMVHYVAQADFTVKLPRELRRDEGGGYILLRFDVDGEPYSCIDVDPAGGWWPADGRSPKDLVDRAAEYFQALSSRLEAIEEINPDFLDRERNAFELGRDFQADHGGERP